MRGSVPSARYSPVCNVLRQWKTSLIPIYIVYRLYDNVHILGRDNVVGGTCLHKTDSQLL